MENVCGQKNTRENVIFEKLKKHFCLPSETLNEFQKCKKSLLIVLQVPKINFYGYLISKSIKNWNQSKNQRINEHNLVLHTYVCSNI